MTAGSPFDDRPRRDDRPAYGGNRSDWNADAKDAAKRKAYEEHADTVHEKLQARPSRPKRSPM
jgi:hypothetical protein